MHGCSTSLPNGSATRPTFKRILVDNPELYGFPAVKAMTFFAPPRRVETTVFTRLPDRFRNPRRTAWADANQGGRRHRLLSRRARRSTGRAGSTSPTFPMAASSASRAEGEWELVAEYDGWPNGLKIHSDGRVFITDYKRGIMLLDPASGTRDRLPGDARRARASRA